MITGREIALALYGTLRLLIMDPGGMAYFNRTVEGFWRSFFAAVLVAPGYAVLSFLHLSAEPVAGHPLRVFLIEVIAYIVGWVAFPLAMFYVARRMQRDAQYIGFIVAYNWAAVLQMAVFLFATAIASGPLGGESAGSAFVLAATLAILLYQWYIARTALEVGAGKAAAVVGIDLALALFVAGIAGAMLRPGGA